MSLIAEQRVDGTVDIRTIREEPPPGYLPRWWIAAGRKWVYVTVKAGRDWKAQSNQEPKA